MILTKPRVCSRIYSAVSKPDFKKLLYSMKAENTVDVSTGSTTYIDDTGNIVTAPAGTPLLVNNKFINLGSWHEDCASRSPATWGISSATNVASGTTIGAFAGRAITNSTVTGGANFYLSSATPATGKQYVTIGYTIGTSGGASILFRDNTASTYSWATTSTPGTWVIHSQAAGALEILADFLHPSGMRILQCSINWTTTGNSLTARFGSYSTSGNVIAYFGSVNHLGHVFPMTALGLSTTAARSGTISDPISVGDKLDSVLGNKVTGNELLTNTSFSSLTGLTAQASVLSVANNELTVADAGSFSSAWELIPTVVGAIYEITASLYATTYAGDLGAGNWNGQVLAFKYTSGLTANGSLAIAEMHATVANTWTTKTIRFTALEPFTHIMYRGQSAYSSKFKAPTVKRCTPSSAMLKLTWTPSFKVTDLPVSTTKAILSTGSIDILSFGRNAGGDGFLRLYDGTNTAILNVSWVFLQTYTIKILYGWNIAAAAYKMQLQVDGSASSLTAYDTSLNPVTALTIGALTDNVFRISRPTWLGLSQGAWR